MAKIQWFEALDRFKEPLVKESDLTQTPLPSRSSMAKHPVQEERDYHGLTIDVALREAALFLMEAQKKGWKKIRIIHGKGLHSKGEPRLKTAMQEFLNKDNRVKASGEESREWGGGGATWVWINVPGK